MSSPIPAIVVQLRDHLDAELGTHRTLLTVAERKQRNLVAGDMTSFVRDLQDEYRVIEETTKLRQTRERLLRTIAASLGLPADDLRIGVILDRIAEPLRAELERRRADLTALLEKLRSLNERTQVLIRHGLAFTRELLSAIVGPSEMPAYDRRGLSGAVPVHRGSLVNLAG